MTGKKLNRALTRAELSEALITEVGLARSDSSALIDQVFSIIIDALAREESVKLSSFGTFQVRHKKPRLGRNPKTGVQAEISERRVVTFRPSHILKARVNGDALTGDFLPAGDDNDDQ